MGSLRTRVVAGYLIVIAAGAFAYVVSGSIAISVVASLGAAALCAVAAALWLTGPLDRLAEAERKLAGGELDTRLPPQATEEFRTAFEAFNLMASAVQTTIAASAQERSRLLAALNSSGDAVLAVDARGRIAFANAAATEQLPRAQGLVGAEAAWVLPDERVIEALEASRVQGERRVASWEQPGRRFLQVMTAPIVAGGDWSVLVVMHDLTDVRRTERMRRDFIANVSHELRTPLASVKAVIETLRDGALDDRAAAQEFLGRADAEIDRVVQVLEELLELSRIESGEVPMAKEPVDIAAVLSRAAGRLRHQAERQGIDLRVDIPGALSPVLGDAERLERVAISLVHNALKFTPAGGHIRIAARPEDGRVLVRVADTGAGIAREDLPRIFERFYKADRARSGAGTGLGLAIVKHTVEAHGGTVSVESQEGRGATFSISLPAQEPRE